MSFLKNLFKKNRTEYSEESDWDRLSDGRRELDLQDPVIREQYVVSCLEQMKDASDELDRVNAEYSLVTSYLTDMEEIEAITGEDKKELEAIARRIHDLRLNHDRYVRTPSTMTEAEYNHMDSLADETVDGIKKLEAEEDYRERVKSDLSRIDKERKAYDYRRYEVKNALENIKGISTIAIVTTVVLIVILLALQIALDLDVKLGYYVAIFAAAVVLTAVYLKYTSYVSEKRSIDSTINGLILLENKVKIRYINNKNLLDYLYTKYEVASAGQLRNLYERYIKEKEDRRAFERNEASYEDELSRLIRKLKTQKINDPEIWIHQSDAIYDNREMVEIRHRLIGRRQKLRKQMEYNQQIAIEAGDEIKDIIAKYPEDSDRLTELVNRYSD